MVILTFSNTEHLLTVVLFAVLAVAIIAVLIFIGVLLFKVLTVIIELVFDVTRNGMPLRVTTIATIVTVIVMTGTLCCQNCASLAFGVVNLISI